MRRGLATSGQPPLRRRPAEKWRARVAHSGVILPGHLSKASGEGKSARKQKALKLATWSLVRGMRVLGPGRMFKVVNRLTTADPVFAELVASSACPPMVEENEDNGGTRLMDVQLRIVGLECSCSTRAVTLGSWADADPQNLT